MLVGWAYHFLVSWIGSKLGIAFRKKVPLSGDESEVSQGRKPASRVTVTVRIRVIGRVGIGIACDKFGVVNVEVRGPCQGEAIRL